MSKPAPTMAQLPPGYGQATNVAPNMSPATVVPLPPVNPDSALEQGDVQHQMEVFENRQKIWRGNFVEDQMWGKCKLIVCALIVFFAIFVLYIVSKRAAD
ncbi:hypothetical protein TeGR_g11341 [Tetraparma gracilis]|uniref:Uncharacterized protein n=1 Tax=Tetraparma gracilis TaxID=2962635 RepID=A0ABQ6MSD1_9STRA|nr:hypothetical protein TeGR_g11341 [Tetraparma gracilis]